jgi:phosphoribosylformylglycinamidine synthase
VVVCDLPIGVLTDEAPCYDRPRLPAPPAAAPQPAVAVTGDVRADLLALLGSPNVGSRDWVWRQYDQIVRGGTVVRPGSDAAVVRVPCVGESKTVDKFLAFAVDCNGRMCEIDAFTGAAMAIAEVCRNLVCSGAEPIGITDCLNFGNPERPEVMESFSRAIDGLAEACRALDVPIVSGNVSLYNETQLERGSAEAAPASRAILPTPTVAAVGLCRSFDDVLTAEFKGPGHTVLLLGDGALRGADALTGSEWLVRRQGRLTRGTLRLDLAAEARLQKCVLELARARVLRSAHDVSDGGLAVTLAECCAAGRERIGATFDLRSLLAGASPIDGFSVLFSEAPSRVVVSAEPAAAARVLEMARGAGVPAIAIGQTGGGALVIHAPPLDDVSVGVDEIASRRTTCLDGIVGGAA